MPLIRKSQGQTAKERKDTHLDTILRVWEAFASIYGFVGAWMLVVELCIFASHPSVSAAYTLGKIVGFIALVYLPSWLAIRTGNKWFVLIAMGIAISVNILALLRLFHCMAVPVTLNQNCS